MQDPREQQRGLLLLTDRHNAEWFGRRHDAFDFLERDRDNVLRVDRVLARLAAHAQAHGAGSLLDVGCGDGRIGSRIAALGYRVSGVDASEEIASAARARGIDAHVADAAGRLPFDDDQFDVVYAGEIIEHLFDTRAFLAELARVTRRGGLCVVTTPNLAHLPDRLGFLLGKSPAQVQPLHPFLKLHIRPFTRSTLSAALTDAGFEIDDFESTLVVWRRDAADPDRVKLATRALARWFPSLGSFLIAYARKL